MLKILVSAFVIVFVLILGFSLAAKAEEIHFDNQVFILKSGRFSPENKGYENEYFLKDETEANRTKMIGIYYFPEINKPLKYSDEQSKKIEADETAVLLKYIENKKADKAAVSYLQNGCANGKNYFEYNIFKYEKHPQKGMMALKYSVRYFFKTNNEITEIGKKVRKENDLYLEKIITSPIPPIVEKDLDDTQENKN